VIGILTLPRRKIRKIDLDARSGKIFEGGILSGMTTEKIYTATTQMN
jgi:hypothetical protein